MNRFLILLEILALIIVIQGEQKQINKFINGVKVIPHVQKKSTGGEDAYYADEGLIAVADGVGGWQRHGIDPSKFSRSLCRNLGNLWKKYRSKYQNNLMEMIDTAHSQVRAVGSSTLVLAAIDPEEPKITIGYLGDSEYILFRIIDSKVQMLSMSEEQQHAFNFPYQLSYTPPSMTTTNEDKAKDAIYQTFDVQDGDILLVGSDGVFDNLYPEQILKILQKKLVKYKNRDYMKSQEDIISDLAEMIADTAFEYSQKTDYRSPFQAEAENQKVYTPGGGKQDDITVVTAIIKINNNNNKTDEKKSDL